MIEYSQISWITLTLRGTIYIIGSNGVDEFGQDVGNICLNWVKTK